MNKMKFYWWIPIVSLFFIEEVAGWVYDAETEKESNGRKNYYSLIWVMNLIVVPLIIYFFIHI